MRERRPSCGDGHRLHRHSAIISRMGIAQRNTPIDNSPTEREFQNVAKLRLNMLFAGSTEGAHRTCVLLGIVATCRAVGVPAKAYLAWAFERLGTHRDLYAWRSKTGRRRHPVDEERSGRRSFQAGRSLAGYAR